MAENPSELDAWEALLQAHAALVPKVGAEVEAATGVPLSWYDVLLELARAPRRRLRMSALGERVVLSRSRVSRIVDELVDEGLVERRPDTEDGRATVTVLTRRGAAALRRAGPVYVDAIRERFGSCLTSAERAAIVTGLGKVIARSSGR